MATNEFIPVVFNDGEPLDPTKLNNLVKNVNNVYQTASLNNQLNSDGTVLAVPVIFTFRHTFTNIAAGASAQNYSFNFADKFTAAELSGSKVYISTGIRNAVGDNDNINVSVSDVNTGSPRLWCSMTGTKTRNVTVDVIAICMREVV